MFFKAMFYTGRIPFRDPLVTFYSPRGGGGGVSQGCGSGNDY